MTPEPKTIKLSDERINVQYGEQTVGAICYDPTFGGSFKFHLYLSSWDWINPAHVKILKTMIDDKIAMLEITRRLLK